MNSASRAKASTFILQRSKRALAWVCQHAAVFWGLCCCFGIRKLPRHTLQLFWDEAGPQALLCPLSWRGHVVCLCTPWGAGIGQQQRPLRHPSRMYQGVISRKPPWASLWTSLSLRGAHQGLFSPVIYSSMNPVEHCQFRVILTWNKCLHQASLCILRDRALLL